MPVSARSFFALCCRLFLAGVFLYASVDKIMDPASFAVALDNYRILPQELLHPMAVAVPWIELVVALLLILGRPALPTALLASLLLAVFTGSVASGVVRGLDISCGCFGPSEADDTGLMLPLLRDVGLLCVSLAYTAVVLHATVFPPRNRRISR